MIYGVPGTESAAVSTLTHFTCEADCIGRTLKMRKLKPTEIEWATDSVLSQDLSPDPFNVQVFRLPQAHALSW